MGIGKGKHPNSLKNLKSWQKGQSGNPKGRKKLLVDDLNKELREEGYLPVSETQIKECFKTMINLPFSLVMEIVDKDNDKVPILYKLVGKHLLGKEGIAMLERLLDRAYGRAKQELEIEGDVTHRFNPDTKYKIPEHIESLTEDERNAIAAITRKITGIK
jgi:hypothetical protein